MSADKRSVSTDALDTLGMVHTKEEKRDAIHLAVEPVVAGCPLSPGDPVEIVDGVAYFCEKGKNLGIVDPFLKSKLKIGDKFWFILNPRLVQSLRHVWEHPEFPSEIEVVPESLSPAEDAYSWIENYAESLSNAEYSISADELIATASYNMHTDNYSEYIVKGGLLEGESVSDEFWNQLAIYTGKDVPEEKRNDFFSCSC